MDYFFKLSDMNPDASLIIYLSSYGGGAPNILPHEGYDHLCIGAQLFNVSFFWVMGLESFLVAWPYVTLLRTKGN